MFNLCVEVGEERKRRSENADRDAQRAAVFGGHMDTEFKEEEAPFSYPRAQRPRSGDLRPRFVSHLLHPVHQNSHPPLLSPGSSLFNF